MVGRNGEPADFAGVAVFLASRASDYVTGQTVYVDGGFAPPPNRPVGQPVPAAPVTAPDGRR